MSSSSSSRIKKTKQVFLDAARQVFAKLGVTGATMNDIAEVSKKGRRTLYTYFKSKEELYYALVEQEMDMLACQLAEVVDKDLPAGEKLVEYIFLHLDCMRDLVQRNGSLKADFFNDIKTVEMLRHPIDLKEIKLLKRILREGVDAGVFEIADINIAANMILYCLKGLEVPYTRQKLSGRMMAHKMEIANFLINGLGQSVPVYPKDLSDSTGSASKA